MANLRQVLWLLLLIAEGSNAFKFAFFNPNEFPQCLARFHLAYFPRDHGDYTKGFQAILPKSQSSTKCTGASFVTIGTLTHEEDKFFDKKRDSKIIALVSKEKASAYPLAHTKDKTLIFEQMYLEMSIDDFREVTDLKVVEEFDPQPTCPSSPPTSPKPKPKPQKKPKPEAQKSESTTTDGNKNEDCGFPLVAIIIISFLGVFLLIAVGALVFCHCMNSKLKKENKKPKDGKASKAGDSARSSAPSKVFGTKNTTVGSDKERSGASSPKANTPNRNKDATSPATTDGNPKVAEIVPATTVEEKSKKTTNVTTEAPFSQQGELKSHLTKSMY